MKQIKYLLLSITFIFLSIFITGCTTDDMNNINIYVTNYANEYVTKSLYGNHSTIKSIYPDGVDITTYKITDKQKKDYARSDLFIYNGLIEKERDLAVDLLSINPDLRIIDSAYVLETDYSPEELWLNPSSLLMMSQNIRLGLEEYITSTYLKKDVDEAYETLKVTLSELDADYRLTTENTNKKTIVVDNSALMYLEKFGLTVYCLDGDVSNKTLDLVEKAMDKKEISYIYNFKNETLSDNANALMKKYSNVKNLSIHRLDNISDTERAENDDYISLTNDNLELLKKELYQ